jgi:hypothetical protein
MGSELHAVTATLPAPPPSAPFRAAAVPLALAPPLACHIHGSEHLPKAACCVQLNSDVGGTSSQVLQGARPQAVRRLQEKRRKGTVGCAADSDEDGPPCAHGRDCEAV